MFPFKLLSVFLSLGLCAPALAAEIGTAASVERNVSGLISGQSVSVAKGDTVHQNETVITATSSSANLRFRDDTGLNIGPNSRVKLDKFVYAPDGSARKIVIELAKGGFRLVSGKSDHRSYEIRTPVATIGLRGTVVGFVVEPDRTTVILKQGAITVCARGRNARCVNASRAEDVIVVTRRGVQPAAPRRSGQPDFQDWCNNAGASCGLQ